VVAGERRRRVVEVRVLVEIWSDVVCPWCAVGEARFAQALERYPRAAEVEVRWRSFELDPHAPAERPGSTVEHLAAKYRTTVAQAQAMVDGMTETAATEGLDFRFDRARHGNTFDAHRLLHLAADRGVQPALLDRLFAASFTEGEPIGDPEALARLAVEVGLDADDVRSVLSSDAYADAVRADEERARELGIGGVPFFVIDGAIGVSGAQPPEVLLQALEQAHARRQPLTVLAGPADAPNCDDDGCEI
jgi:predicted DsbA family dithiol-disulfide isomerase